MVVPANRSDIVLGWVCKLVLGLSYNSTLLALYWLFCVFVIFANRRFAYRLILCGCGVSVEFVRSECSGGE